jgi:hypothetical protein
MLVNVGEVLNAITELGFVSFSQGVMVQSIKPLFNVYTEKLSVNYFDRWNSTVRYLEDYGRYHPDFEGHYFLCLYDGWREYSEPTGVGERIHVPWNSYNTAEKVEYFSGKGSIGEPRFVSRVEKGVYMDLPFPVLAYNRHEGDSNVLLIPDSEFLETEFKASIRDVISNDIPFEMKLSQIIWRGSEHVNDGYQYVVEGYEHQMTKIHPRILACSISHSVGMLTPDISTILNASFANTTRRELLKYKYQLDLDGAVSAWSGLFWKLSSSSVVFKLRSHWEQWYYNKLLPHVHYVPLRNLSPYEVEAAFTWCDVTHTRECRGIADAANELVRSLTYEYAVKRYTIH